MGAQLMEGLCELAKESKIVGDVRGRGLLMGIELVKDKKTKAYGIEEAAEVMEAAKELGLLLGKGGLNGNVLRVAPPLCINENDVSEIVRMIAEAVKATERKLGY